MYLLSSVNYDMLLLVSSLQMVFQFLLLQQKTKACCELTVLLFEVYYHFSDFEPESIMGNSVLFPGLDHNSDK